MLRSIRACCLSIISVVLFFSCATVPTHQAWRPWTRTLESDDIPLGARLRTTVSGETDPLLGDDELTAGEIEKIADDLLGRRGFTVDDSDPEYDLRVSYYTERKDKLFSMSTASYRSTSLVISASESGARSGLWVALARAVGIAFLKSETSASQTSETSVFYTHAVSAEMHNGDGHVVWKGESTWDTWNLDIIADIVPALQLILSDLPCDSSARPAGPEVKLTHAVNYFQLECEGNWFSCPALPFRIRFDPPMSVKEPDDLRSVKNPEALAAYVDVIQTAEYALPQGDKNWGDPIRPDLWKRVLLGGQYNLEPHGRPVSVLIKLLGESRGYKIEKCWVASVDEWADFRVKMSEWRKALEDYYDVFEQ